ncbi:MAG: hypothetical protein JSR37_06705 [Verrucomicrobia bacterium]|nr:hypothetical protein [Verrucomicrobiota bacterium]
MQPTALQSAFFEAVRPNGLIELVTTLRDEGQKYNISKNHIYNVFKGCTLWVEQDTKSGHVAFKHRITGVTVGYQNHGEPKLDPGAVVALRDEVQKHLNILANDVFAYRVNHWKVEPNWAQAEQRCAARGSKASKVIRGG